jgi:DNA-directed RNA polymerase subunit RPC12/RpoP
MATCASCGNEYDKPLEITKDGETHTFDSFECAIHKLAPRCEHCGVTVIGHGVEAGGHVYCCAHCAAHEGHEELRDRAG